MQQTLVSRGKEIYDSSDTFYVKRKHKENSFRNDDLSKSSGKSTTTKKCFFRGEAGRAKNIAMKSRGSRFKDSKLLHSFTVSSNDLSTAVEVSVPRIQRIMNDLLVKLSRYQSRQSMHLARVVK